MSANLLMANAYKKLNYLIGFIVQFDFQLKIKGESETYSVHIPLITHVKKYLL